METNAISQLNLIAIINGGTFVTALTIALKIARFMNRAEFKIEILWKDYEERNHNRRSEDREYNNE